MGRFNSSTYRVTPLAEEIKANPKSFQEFLNIVNNLADANLNFPCPSDAECFCYGDHEKKLKPPKEHLIAIVKEQISAKKIKIPDKISEKRLELFGFRGEEKREKAIKTALNLIEKNYDSGRSRAWYIFEGESCPDLYIESEDSVILCEGKWTEGNITQKTTYLENRNQMVRHIQGALNYLKLKGAKKKLYAFYIVDKKCTYTSELETEKFKEHLAKESIAPENPCEIIDSYYGFTTWEGIAEKIKAIPFKSKKEIIEQG